MKDLGVFAKDFKAFHWALPGPLSAANALKILRCFVNCLQLGLLLTTKLCHWHML